MVPRDRLQRAQISSAFVDPEGQVAIPSGSLKDCTCLAESHCPAQHVLCPSGYLRNSNMHDHQTILKPRSRPDFTRAYSRCALGNNNGPIRYMMSALQTGSSRYRHVCICPKYKLCRKTNTSVQPDEADSMEHQHTDARSIIDNMSIIQYVCNHTSEYTFIVGHMRVEQM